MLTIKAPIKLAARPSMVSLDDAFGKRIEANYNVMAGSLTPENMLHFIAQKQDILMEEGSMTSIVAVDNRINRQQINVELINNVLNRILVADEQKLSYQDRVFIDNVLSRIGITDVKQFMSQVTYLKQNTTNINKLLSLYNTEGTALEELRQYFRQTDIHSSSTNSSSNVENNTNVRWLHQMVSNRLKAGDIYTGIENHFINTQTDNHYTDDREYLVQSNINNSSESDIRTIQESKSEQWLYQEVINRLKAGDIYIGDENHFSDTHIDNRYVDDREYLSQTSIDNYEDSEIKNIEDSHTDIWLHQNVLNRLQVGNIYNELENYFKNTGNVNRYIDDREFYVSEQLFQAKNIMLNNVRNDITNKNMPLDYMVMNTYELGVDEEYNTSEGDVRNEYIKAVVLNAVNNAYTLRSDEINNDNHVWFSLLESVKQTADNTMMRFESIHEHRNSISHESIEQYNEVVQTKLKNEITSLETLYKNYSAGNISNVNVNSINDNIINHLEQINQDDELVQNSTINNIINEHNSISKQLSTLSELNKKYSKVWNNISEQYNTNNEKTFVHSDMDEENIFLNQTNQGTDVSIENENNTTIEAVKNLHNSFSDSLSSITQRYEENVKNADLTYADNTQIKDSVINNIEQEYSNEMKQLISNELNKLSEIKSEFYNEQNKELKNNTQKINNISQDNRHYAQQINYLTNEEEQLKNQLNNIKQTNVDNTRQLNNITKNTDIHKAIHINRAKTMADAMRALENPDEVKLEYMNVQNNIDNTKEETVTSQQKIDKNILNIFEQIAKYQKNPSAPHPDITTASAALASLMKDTKKTAMPQEQLIERNITDKTEQLIHDVRQQEIRQQLEKIINVEVPEISYIRQPQNVELLHKVAEAGIDEEVLEELRSVNRNIDRKSETHTDEVTESENITRTVTNRVNNLELRRSDELTQIIAENVHSQLNNLTDKVYRKLEKRMDNEKRRRGL